jgi:hypothetical protein
MTTTIVALAIVVYLILCLWIGAGWPAGDAPRRPYHLNLHRSVAVIAMLVFGPFGLFFFWGAFSSLRMVLKGVWTGVFEQPNFIDDTGNATIWRSEQPGDFWLAVRLYTVVAVVLGSIALSIFLPLSTYIRR